MDFRNWLINEELFKTIPGQSLVKNPRSYAADPWIEREVTYPVYRNPTKQELAELTTWCKEFSDLEIGGVITPTNNLYVWPRRLLTHDNMGFETKEDTKMAFTLRGEGHTISVAKYTTPDISVEEIQEHPRMKEMLGLPEPMPA